MYHDPEINTLLSCLLLVLLGFLITIDLAIYAVDNQKDPDESYSPFLNDDGNHSYYERSLITKSRFFLSHPEIPRNSVRSFTRLFLLLFAKFF